MYQNPKVQRTKGQSATGPVPGEISICISRMIFAKKSLPHRNGIRNSLRK